jgi:hypothetical protein
MPGETTTKYRMKHNTKYEWIKLISALDKVVTYRYLLSLTEIMHLHRMQ